MEGIGYVPEGGEYPEIGGGGAGSPVDRPPEPPPGRAGPGCDYCLEVGPRPGTVLYFGGGTYAILRSCPACGSGAKIADTTVPACIETP